MYSIFADGTLIYDDRLNQDDLRVLNPRLTLEDNAAGSFEMSLPPTNVGYGSIARITSIITVKRNGVEIWEGRVLTEDRDFWNNRKLLCEGELAYFNDTIQPPAEYKNKTVKQFLQAIVSNHNSNVAASKRFTVGTVDVTDSANVVYYTNYERSIDAIGDKLIGVYGGHLRIRKENGTRYLDYLKDYPSTNSQVIRFGENLLDFALNWDMSNFATVLLPLGKRLENSPIENLDAYLTVESVNGGSKYVINQSAVNSYGRIEKIVNWDSVETAAELLAKANEYMADIQYDRLTIELSALDLHYLNVNYEAVKLLDKIRVVSDPHGMDRLFPVTKLEIPLDEPQNTKFRLGDEAVMTLTNLIKNINTDIIYKVETLPKEEVILTKADDRATAIAQDKVDKRTKGYITITQDSNGSDAMYITNQQSISASTKGWKWDLDGLSFATKSAGSETWNTPSVAMNMDGSIVADRITTGTLKSQNNNFSLALNDGTLTMKKGSINIGSNAFKVDTDGSVTITKGSLSIGANDNFKVTSTGDVTIKNGNISLTQGSININDKFVVTSAGVVTITEGTINLGNNALTIDNQGNISVTKGNLNLGNGAFQVNNNGSATITAGSIDIGSGAFVVTNTGSVSITEGTINVGDDGLGNPMFSVNALGEVEARKIILGDAWTIDASTRPTAIESNWMGISEHGVVAFFETDYDDNYMSYLSVGTYRNSLDSRWPESGPYIKIGSIAPDQTSGFGIYSDSYTGLPKLYYARKITQNFPVSDRWYFGCDIDGSHYTDPADHSAGITKITAYNLLLDPNTSGAVGGPSTTYIMGDSNVTVKNGFITGYSQLNTINHRNIFRGKSLGTSITAAQKKAIWNGTFSGMYVGDYWTINGVNWTIVDMDYWYGAGAGSTYNKHHLIIMPSKNLYVANMNSTNINNTGYAGSNMYSANLADARTAVNAAFPNLVLSHQDYLSNAVDTNGIITASSVYTIDVDLPSELMVYGSNVMSNRYDPSVTVSISRSKLAYFRLNPRYDNRGEYSWLKDPSGTARFCVITTSGYIAAYNASNTNPGVRPIFAMGPSSDPG